MSGEAAFWAIIGLTVGALLVIGLAPGLQSRYLLAFGVLVGCAALMYFGGAGWFWTGVPAVAAALVVLGKIGSLRSSRSG